VSDLAAAAESGDHLSVLKALRKTLILAMADETTSNGVKPQYAKQISDLSREIAELEPKKTEASEVDGFSNGFTAAI
jgi:hypothetical protein